MIRHSLPGIVPSTFALCSVIELKFSSVYVCPVPRVSASGVGSPASVSRMPSRLRSTGGVWNSAAQAVGRFTGSNVLVGRAASREALLPDVGTANRVPPGMPSSDSFSVLVWLVVLISSSAEPLRTMPYGCRKSKLVWKAATPQKEVLESVPPDSSTNTAAHDAVLPILITSIVPDAVSSNQLSVVPVTTRVPISSSTPPRIASSGVFLLSLNRPPARSSIPPVIDRKKTRLVVVCAPPVACGSSNNLNASVPPMPRLPALSLHLPGRKVTPTVPP